MLQESILQCFRPSLSYHLSLRPLFCLFLSGRFRQVLLYTDLTKRMGFKGVRPQLRKFIKVSKGAMIRNRYNKVPHLTNGYQWKVTNSQLDTTNKSQEVSPFPAGELKAKINRRAQSLKLLLYANFTDFVYRVKCHPLMMILS